MTAQPVPSRSHALSDEQTRSAARLFSVLSEPTRLHILHALQDGRASVSEIIERTGLKQANASKQLGILFSAGLLDREREGNVVRYSIRMPLVFDLCTLVCTCMREDAQARAQALR